MLRATFQVTHGHDNESAYRQFFGIESRVPEMQRRGWTGQLRLVWSRTLADRKNGRSAPEKGPEVVKNASNRR